MIYSADRAESGTNCGDMQGCTAEAVFIATGTGQSDSQDDCLPASHLPGSVMVRRTKVPEESKLATISFIRSTGDVKSGGSVGTRMMVHQNKPGEWEKHNETGARSSCGNRHILARLGSSLQGHPNRGSMVLERTGTSHKLPGASCSYFCSEGIHQGPGEYTCPLTHE